MLFMKNSPLNFLVADDDAVISRMVSTILARLGHHVDVVPNGKEAIVLFSQKPEFYDVLITDHSMPCVCGLELVQHLRKNDFSGKIIVMSGSLTEDLLVAYRGKRVDKILQKPISPGVLTESIRHMLEQWEKSGAIQPQDFRA